MTARAVVNYSAKISTPTVTGLLQRKFGFDTLQTGDAGPHRGQLLDDSCTHCQQDAKHGAGRIAGAATFTNRRSFGISEQATEANIRSMRVAQ
jgi:hypothetical protein